jgi:hypothetical protein
MCRVSARSEARGARHVAVGDIVDSTAKRVDLIHRIALRGRQNAHGEIERAAGRGGSGVDFCIVHDKIGNSQDDLRWRRPLKGVQEV